MGFLVNEDGSLNWLEKSKNINKKTKNIEKQITSSIFQYFGLYSCNIESNTVNESIKISKKDFSIHLMIDEITSVEISNDIVCINTSDQLSYYLTFINENEAIAGHNKIEDAINGDEINCTELNTLRQFYITPFDNNITTVQYPMIIFVDNLEPIEVISKSDMINKLNVIANGEYTVSDFVSSNLGLTLTYKPHKEEYVFKTINFLSRNINFEIKTDSLYLNLDLLKNPYYVFYNGSEIKPENNYYYFNETQIITISVYFASNYCDLFEIGNSPTHLKFLNNNSVVQNSTSNYPIIKKFKSNKASLINLDFLFFNSVDSLEEVIIENNGSTIDLHLNLTSLKILIMSNCYNQHISFPQTLESLKLNNVSIDTLLGIYPNLSSLQITNCGKLNLVNLTNSPFKDIFIDNVPITSFQINNNWDKLYSLTLSKTNINEISINNNVLISLNYLDIKENLNLSIEKYEAFLSNFVEYNKSKGGYLNLINKNVSLEFNEDIFALKSKGWEVVMF